MKHIHVSLEFSVGIVLMICIYGGASAILTAINLLISKITASFETIFFHAPIDPE